MPTPKDHRDITIAVNFPPASHEVRFDLTSAEEGTGVVLEDLEVDTENTDLSYRRLTVTEGSTLVLEVETYLRVHVPLSPSQTSTKVVDQFGQPEPLATSAELDHPGTDNHAWVASGFEAELAMAASTPLGSATVNVQEQGDGVWSITVMDANDERVASGFIQVPREAAKVRRLAETG